MNRYHDIGLYFVSLFTTLLVFAFGAMFLVVAAEGAREDVNILSITQEDPLHAKLDVAGSSLQLDYTPLVQPEQFRREYAPLLTPRALLTAEYAAEYASYWGGVLYDSLEEYLFMRETGGQGAVEVAAQKEAKSF